MTAIGGEIIYPQVAFVMSTEAETSLTIFWRFLDSSWE